VGLLLSDKEINNNSSQGLKRGLVQVITGEGKGKTTSAVGSIVRAIGSGLRVYAAVLMKGNITSGEWAFLSRQPGVTIEIFNPGGFCDPARPRDADREQARLAVKNAMVALTGGKYDIVVIDEINVAVAWKLIDVADVIKLIDARPEKVELILTGRYADPRIIEKADLVTEMRKIKHPLDAGIPARKGIEF
jgi:cob(I)alamin adenosyltransferase